VLETDEGDFNIMPWLLYYLAENLSTHSTRGWVGLRTGKDLEKRKISCPCQQRSQLTKTTTDPTHYYRTISLTHVLVCDHNLISESVHTILVVLLFPVNI